MSTDHDIRRTLVSGSSQHGIDLDALHTEITRAGRRRRHQRRAAAGVGVAAAAVALSVGAPMVRDAAVSTSSTSAASTPDPERSEQHPPGWIPPQQAAANSAFLAGCYTEQDAETLAAQWKSPSAQQAKVTAGQMLLDGQSLPIPPGGAAAIAAGATPPGWSCASLTEDQQNFQQSFTAHGYTRADAEALAAQWNSPDALSAEIIAGGKLASGEGLPIKPSGQATTP